jgi:hypothetical protein
LHDAVVGQVYVQSKSGGQTAGFVQLSRLQSVSQSPPVQRWPRPLHELVHASKADASGGALTSPSPPSTSVVPSSPGRRTHTPACVQSLPIPQSFPLQLSETMTMSC